MNLVSVSLLVAWSRAPELEILFKTSANRGQLRQVCHARIMSMLDSRVKHNRGLKSGMHKRKRWSAAWGWPMEAEASPYMACFEAEEDCVERRWGHLRAGLVSKLISRAS